MKIADFRLTFSKKEFPNGAICKSFFAISTFATYLPHHTAQKALALQLPARSRAPSAPTRRAAAACLPAHQAPTRRAAAACLPAHQAPGLKGEIEKSNGEMRDGPFTHAG
jgi:hypothetical protein